MNSKVAKRHKIKRRVRAKISGTAERPRLSVFRSNKNISVQLIDDVNQHTLLSHSSEDKTYAKEKGPKVDTAKKVGLQLGKMAADKGITNVVFDRNGYLYHGRVKALAEGAREGGLKF